VSSTYKNGKDLVVERKDEEGVTYPKVPSHTDYRCVDPSVYTKKSNL
jgi:hypothetical protein